jgi:biotin transport system permease protein
VSATVQSLYRPAATPVLYVPGRSVVHRAPAGLKLLALSGLGAALFAVPTLPAAVVALVGVGVLGWGAARLPARVLAGHLRPVLVWAVLLFAVHAATTGPAAGAATALRLLALVLAAAVVTCTTRVTELVAVVERVCAPLAWVGVSPARVGLVLAMALRFIPLVSERAARVREAHAARGGSLRGVRGTAALVVPLLVQVLRLAHTVGEALEARGADELPPTRRPRAAPSASEVRRAG